MNEGTVNVIDDITTPEKTLLLFSQISHTKVIVFTIRSNKQ